MIILDTNVVSELMRGSGASPAVLNWVRGLAEQPVTTVVTRAEILAGVALLPAGQRRDRLESVATAAFDTLGACLPLVPGCAAQYADIVATRRSIGRPIGAMDALIAAIARFSGSALATRDTEDFEHLGLDLVDPYRGDHGDPLPL
ncbi:type II toxin-antitoxin system VapC family toxin [Pseudactinotalea sp. Z1739]|uniref:type II toxin-antitoxin system VapC family toxin n=1 Tax=Pseudactinotalea sp. Z1739 TaxID=3413028 RepID=UPI003C7E4F53